MSYYQWRGRDLILHCYLQPSASRDEVVGVHAPDNGPHSLKIRITAAPVEGKANRHLIKFLAKAFAVGKSEVALLQGGTGRHKKLCVRNPNKIPVEFGIQPPA